MTKTYPIRQAYSAMLDALIDKYVSRCDPAYAPVLEAVRKLGRLLQAGRLYQLRPVFDLLNRRLLRVRNDSVIWMQHRSLLRAITRFRLAALAQGQDAEIGELAFMLVTASRTLSADPARTIFLTDCRKTGTYIDLFCQEVNAAADILILSAAIPFERERLSA